MRPGEERRVRQGSRDETAEGVEEACTSEGREEPWAAGGRDNRPDEVRHVRSVQEKVTQVGAGP